MLDQPAVTARVVARLDTEGRSLLELTAPEVEDRVAAAFAELLGETPAYPAPPPAHEGGR